MLSIGCRMVPLPHMACIKHQVHRMYGKGDSRIECISVPIVAHLDGIKGVHHQYKVVAHDVVDLVEDPSLTRLQMQSRLLCRLPPPRALLTQSLLTRL